MNQLKIIKFMLELWNSEKEFIPVGMDSTLKKQLNKKGLCN